MELLVASDARDISWVKSRYAECVDAGESVTVYAPCFAAQEGLTQEGIPFETFEELAWELPKHELYDKARRLSWEWFQLPELQQAVAPVREYKGYPLMEMHWSLLLLSMKEVQESNALAARVLAAVRPDAVSCGKRPNPFAKYWLAALTGDRGLEAEATRSLCEERGIPVRLFERDEVPAVPAVSNQTQGLKDRALYLARRAKWSVLGRLQPPPWIGGFRFPKRLTGPRVLVYTWGGYYFKQVAPAIEELARQGARVAVALFGGTLPKAERVQFQRLGVVVFNNDHWLMQEAQAMHAHWEQLGQTTFAEVRNEPALESLFSVGGESFLPGLGELALERELVKALPDTVTRLARAEAVQDAFAPDVVLSHFAQHPQGVAETLVARKRGVPTVNCGHGNPPAFAMVRNTFATRYVATPGNRTAKALRRLFSAGEQFVRPVGDARLEESRRRMGGDKGTVAQQLGLDPEKPVCVFCDMTGWTTKTTIWRHATRAALEQAARLATDVPDMQLVYRVHHGGEYAKMREWLARECPEVIFQLTNEVTLTDILDAADVVVSHNCSAVTEALTHGVPVVFLCSHGDVLPDYAQSDSMKVARSYDELASYVSDTLKAGQSRQQVLDAAVSYFDHALSGLDGRAGERLAGLVFEAAANTGEKGIAGWQDWLTRIEASCGFESRKLSGMDVSQEAAG